MEKGGDGIGVYLLETISMRPMAMRIWIMPPRGAWAQASRANWKYKVVAVSAELSGNCVFLAWG